MSKKTRLRALQSVPAASPVVETPVDTQVLPVADPAPEAPATEVPPAEVPSAETAPAETPAPEAPIDPEYDPYAVSAQVVEPKGARKYPRVGGKCWQVWNFCDEQVAAGVHVNVKLCRDHALAVGWNVSNASQEFYGWRKFRGYGA